MPVPVTIDEHSNYLARLLAIVRLFAAVHESGSGPSRHFVAMQNLVAIEGITDIEQAVPMSSRLARCKGRTPSPRRLRAGQRSNVVTPRSCGLNSRPFSTTSTTAKEASVQRKNPVANGKSVPS